MRGNAGRVLIVDGDPRLCAVLGRELSRCGLSCQAVPDGAEARTRLRGGGFDLLIADISAPGIGDLDLIACLRRDHPSCKVILTADQASREYLAQALMLGVFEYLEKPLRMSELVEVVKRALRGDWAVPQLAVKAAEAIRLRSQAEQASLDSVRALVRAVEAKDPYTRRHSEHVAYYAVSLAQAMGQPETIVESVRVASLLHDIGKIGVPDHILTKRGDLTEAEFAHIRRHPALGAEMLSTITSFRHEATLVRYHHERWDGRGYPDGLRGPASPLGSRIMGVADAIDAMLMPRTYKDAYPLSRVLEELRRCAGTQFDPEIAAIAERWCRANPDRLILPDDARAPVVPAIGAQVRST